MEYGVWRSGGVEKNRYYRLVFIAWSSFCFLCLLCAVVAAAVVLRSGESVFFPLITRCGVCRSCWSRVRCDLWNFFFLVLWASSLRGDRKVWLRWFLCLFCWEVLFLWKVVSVYSEAGGGGWYVVLLPAPALRFILELLALGSRLLTLFPSGGGLRFVASSPFLSFGRWTRALFDEEEVLRDFDACKFLSDYSLFEITLSSMTPIILHFLLDVHIWTRPWSLLLRGGGEAHLAAAGQAPRSWRQSHQESKDFRVREGAEFTDRPDHSFSKDPRSGWSSPCILATRLIKESHSLRGVNIHRSFA